LIDRNKLANGKDHSLWGKQDQWRVRGSINNNSLLALKSNSMSTIFCKLGDWEQDIAYIRNIKSVGNSNKNSISSRCIYHLLKSGSGSGSGSGINGRGIAKMNLNTLPEWNICVIIEMTMIRAKITSSIWVKEGIIFACLCKESNNFSSNYDMSRKRGGRYIMIFRKSSGREIK